MNAPSFHTQVTIGQDGTNFTAEGDYLAPDRLRITGGGDQEGTVPTTTIRIGDDEYTSTPDGQGKYLKACVPGGLSDFMLPLSIATSASGVNHVGNDFTFTGSSEGGPAVEGKATVTNDGYLSYVHVAFEAGGDALLHELTFSDFGKPVSIEPPPQSMVHDLGMPCVDLPSPSTDGQG